MRMPSADRVTKAPPGKRYVPPFKDGDRMDQRTFHAMYKQTPDGFKAELIGGHVYMASPVSKFHGRPHRRLCWWLDEYISATAGVDGFDNTTNIQNDENEPQPDLTLIVDPACGGQTTEDEEGSVVGPAELVVEVANATLFVDRTVKLRNYERAGVLEYLIVLVQTEEVEWHVRGKHGFELIASEAGGVFKSRVFPGLWLDPAGVFDRTSKRLLAALNAGLASKEHAKFVAKLRKAARKGSR